MPTGPRWWPPHAKAGNISLAISRLRVCHRVSRRYDTRHLVRCAIPKAREHRHLLAPRSRLGSRWPVLTLPGFNNLIAYTLDNGAISIFDIETSTSDVLSPLAGRLTAQALLGHNRTVNSVRFHPGEPHLVFSGSQDHTMRQFDLRCDPKCVRIYNLHGAVRQVCYRGGWGWCWCWC